MQPIKQKDNGENYIYITIIEQHMEYNIDKLP